MDDDTMKALGILREVNEALIAGLEGAIFCMENWKDLTPEAQKSSIDKLKALIAQSNKYYGAKPTEH
jgi:hypothetical protein